MSPSTHTTAREGSSSRVGHRRTAAALLAAALLVVPMPFVAGPAAAAPTCGLDGAGTKDSRFRVEDAEDLKQVGVGACGLNAHYLQTKSFTLTGTHTPIGDVHAPFTGVYDGGGNTITGLSVDEGNADNVGLFGFAEDAEFRDLTLADVDVLRGGESVGALVGYLNDGRVENVHVSGDVTGVKYVGGLIGRAVGGTKVERSSASVDVTAKDVDAGGLIGYSEATITESYATGDVVGEGPFDYGGLVGYQKGGSIHRSYATGSVTGESYVGGLVGYSQGAVLKDVYAHGDVTATATTGPIYAGGLVGQLFGGAVDRAYSIGLVKSDGEDLIHGLIGSVFQDETATPPVRSTVKDSFWDVQTSGFTTGTDSSSAGAVGLDSAQMKLLATYSAVGWDIVARVQEPNDKDSPVWGILAGRNGGYPFLQALVGTSSPGLGSGSAPASTLAVTCAPAVPAVGGTVTCTVTGGDPGIDILWRAAYNPTFAGAGVTLDADGTGMFSFVVPREALGQPLTVELVEWTAPVSLGVVGAPVPASIPAGDGSSLPAGGFALLLALLGLTVRVAMRRSADVTA